MTLGTSLRIAIHVQLAAAALSLITAGSDTVASGYMLLIFTVLAWPAGGLWPRNVKSRKRLWNSLALIMLIAFVAELGLAGDLLAPVVRLVVFLSIYKLFTITANRDFITILLLSFLLMLAAASISYDSVYAVPYVIYVLSTGITLFLHTKKTGIEREQHSRNIITGLPSAADINSVKAQKLWSALALAVLTLVLTAAIFPLFPRLRTNIIAPGNQSQIQAVSGFSQTVSLEAIGNIKRSPAIIMRVQVRGDRAALPRPPKLRGIVLSLFDGDNWRHSFTNGRTIRAGGDRIYRINAPAQGLQIEQEIFLNPISSRVIFASGIPVECSGPFRVIYADKMNSLFMGRRQFQQIHYTCDSRFPVWRNRIVYDQRPPTAQELQRLYLQLPGNGSFSMDDYTRIQEMAREITQGRTSRLEQARAIERHLSTAFSYSLQLSQYAGVDNKMTSFLFDKQSGHCEYFASGMVLLCRSIGLPARMVNGFQLGQLNPVADIYTVRAADAHSWVEIYIDGVGWIEFDPTPAGGQQSEFASQTPDFWKNLVDSLDLFWMQYVLAFDIQDQQAVFNTLQLVVSGVSNLFTSISEALLGLIPGLELDADTMRFLSFVLSMLLFAATLWSVYQFVLKPVLKALTKKADDRRSPVKFFQQLTLLLAKRGIRLQPHESAITLVKKSGAEGSEKRLLSKLVSAYQQARFDMNPQRRERALAKGTRHLKELRKSLGNK